jgi:hypothetical protein
MTYPTHHLIPDPTTGYALNPARGWVTVYLPSATTNLFRNPSFERDTANWTATSDGSTGTPFDRTTAAQFRGAYAGILTIRPSGGTFVQIVGATNATAGQVYALSAHFKRPGGANVDPDNVRAVVNGTNVPWQSVVYVADGWWRGELVYTATGSNPAGVRVTGSPSQVYYVDALQWELAGECSTYCDGDEAGLIPGETPPAYTWNGTPHASTSTRSAVTRAGGLRRNLDSYGLTVVGLIGLGTPPQDNQTIPYAGVDGSFYQGARRPERGFTIAAAFQARTPQELDRQRRDVRAALAFDRTGVDSPVTLELQAFSGETAIGEAVTCVCSYAGGLEANQGSLYAEKASVQLVEHVPGLTSLASRGGAFGATAGRSDFIAVRDETDGSWSYPATISSAVSRNAFVFGPDERLYIGGAFTGVGNRVAAYNFQTGAWETLSTGLGAQVNALVFDRQGRLYAGGASGLITGSTVARWDGVSWTAIGTLTDTVQALAYDPVNDRIYAGGSNGANATLQRSNGGAAWNVITNATAGEVRDLAYDQGVGILYIAGNFSAALGGVVNAVHVARYTFASGLAALSTGANGAAQSVTIDRRGRAWFSGAFTTLGGVAVGFIGRWTGQVFEAIPGVAVEGGASTTVVYADPQVDGVWADSISINGNGVGYSQLVTESGPLTPGILMAGGIVRAVARSPRRTAIGLTGSNFIPPATATLPTIPGTLPTPLQLVLTQASNESYYTIVGVGGSPATLLDVGITTLAAGDYGTIGYQQGGLLLFSQYRGDLRGAVRLGSNHSATLIAPLGGRSIGLVRGSSSTAVYFCRPRYGALGDAVR